jgi:anti-sigma regulatory factor (Ser/Thr protein kinase)
MAQTITAPPRAWSRRFPATPAQARKARQSLARLLDCHPGADDAALCLGELASNAALHSRSGDGGYFTVTARLTENSVRVEVQDQGGPWAPPSPTDDLHGRGLLIVGQLASAWGRTGSSDTGWTVWFTMDCS